MSVPHATATRPGTRRSHAWALVLAATLGLAGPGCAMVEKDRRAVALQAATNGYQSALRWGYFDNALAFLAPEQRRDPALVEQLAGLRLTGYEVVQPPVIQEDGRATQTVVIDYLRVDTQVVRRMTDRQVWRWDETMKTWWLDSGLPDFGGKPTP